MLIFKTNGMREKSKMDSSMLKNEKGLEKKMRMRNGKNRNANTRREQVSLCKVCLPDAFLKKSMQLRNIELTKC